MKKGIGCETCGFRILVLSLSVEWNVRCNTSNFPRGNTGGGICGLWLPCIAIVYTLYSIYVLYVLRRHCRVLVWNRSTTCTISSLLHQILRVSYMFFFCLAEILAELLILMSLVHLLSVFLLLSQRLPIFASSFVAVRSAIRWVYQQHCWLIYYISSS